MLFFGNAKQTKVIEDLRSSLTHSRKHAKQLLEHVQALAQDKNTLQRSLAMLGHRLVVTEAGRDAIQKQGNDNLEELRALRRLENAVAAFTNGTGFLPAVKQALRDVDATRAKART